jgi:hypothetical protein
MSMIISAHFFSHTDSGLSACTICELKWLRTVTRVMISAMMRCLTRPCP